MANKIKKIPSHLQRYLIKQDYASYTPVDHALWRFIMRELTTFLNKHAHPTYKSGIKKTGVSLDEIPSIAKMDKCLKKIGWRAVCCSGFIPPAAFMELQANRILPIATEMRRVEHLDYTPAPDIVHEAAGHAPMLANREFSKFLQKFSEVAYKAIITKADYELYESIREMSDLKELAGVSEDQIKSAENKLDKVNSKVNEPSEASLLSRMNWWTAEYGLFGNINNPKIIGAGLLSSVGESQSCLQKTIKKIPFSVDCINYTYDITEPQPQLFVAKDFKSLSRGLDDMAEKMAFKRGGIYGLKKAQEAETVNTVELNTGIQISGILKTFKIDEKGEVAYLQFNGPSQLSVSGKELIGHGVRRHKHGFGTPVGELINTKSFSKSKYGKLTRLEFTSGVVVIGVLKNIFKINNKPVILTFKKCTVSLSDEILFKPEWGEFDMVVGKKVVSVFGGASDRKKFGYTEDFVQAKIPPRKFTTKERKLHKLYLNVRKLRTSFRTSGGSMKISSVSAVDTLNKILNELNSHYPDEWLLRFEIYEQLIAMKKTMSRSELIILNKKLVLLKEDIQVIVEKWPNLKSIVNHSFELLRG